MKCSHCGRDCSRDSHFCRHCGQPFMKDPDSPAVTRPPLENGGLGIVPGEVFAGRYRIISEIGRGGMGRIYRADDLELGTRVALKVIRPEYLDDPRMIRRFKKEILLAREVSHPNVVRIHDFGESGGVKFITMQYVDGENLKDVIRDAGPLSLDAVISISCQLLEGLSAAHRHNILHRDLKPHNIMITEAGDVVITDFGLAKSLMAADGSVSGTLIGTPQYIPPEQWRGQKLTAAADIYAVGIIMFEMLTTRCPFKADSDVGYLDKHINSRPLFTRQEEARIPLFLRRIVLRCLEKHPGDRYSDVAALLNDIRLGNFSTRPFRSRVSAAVRGRRARVAVALISVAAIVLGIIPWLRSGQGGDAIPSRQSLAVLNFENETGEPVLDRWRSALPDLLITDLAQSRLIRMVPENRLFQELKRLDVPPEGPFPTEILQRMGATLGVSHFVTGSFARAGDRFRVNLRILDPESAEILYTESASGVGESCFFPMVDELTRKIKTRFGFSPRDLQRDIDKEIGKITTSSPEAMKFYVMGQQHFRGSRFPQSLDAFHNAIRIDPEFALAYRAAAESCGYMEKHEDEKKYILKAMSLLERVSHREQFLIQGYAASAIQQDSRKAAEIFKSLLEVYPDDEEAGMYLGAMLRNLGKLEEARQSFARLLEKNPNHRLALLNLLYIDRVQGKYPQALRLLHEHGSRGGDGDPAFVNYWTSVIMTCQGRLEEARLEVRAALREHPRNTLYNIQMGNVCQLMGDKESAEDRYRKLLERSEHRERIRGNSWLACLRVEQGRFREALQLVAGSIAMLREPDSREAGGELSLRLINLDMMEGGEQLSAECKRFLESITAGERDEYTPKLLAYQGVNALKAQRMVDARKKLERLRNLPESFYGISHLRFRFYLAARLSEAEGNFTMAVKHMEGALSQLENQSGRFDEHAFFFFHAARLYRLAGERRKAIEFSRRILDLNYGRLRYGRIYIRTHYDLARDYQSIGWEGKALECYRDYLKLDAGEADPWRVKDARAQINLLSRMTAG